jgi:hypothetical protein
MLICMTLSYSRRTYYLAGESVQESYVKHWYESDTKPDHPNCRVISTSELEPTQVHIPKGENPYKEADAYILDEEDRELSGESEDYPYESFKDIWNDDFYHGKSKASLGSIKGRQSRLKRDRKQHKSTISVAI